MKEQNCHHEKHGGNGFLLGVVVGVVIALLFTTKRGREILKEMTDRGIKKWSELEQLTKEMEDKEFFEDEMDDEKAPYVAPEEKKEIRILAKQTTPVASTAPEQPKAEPTKVEKKPEVKTEKEDAPVETKSAEKTLTGRRWFRGLRKKAV